MANAWSLQHEPKQLFCADVAKNKKLPPIILRLKQNSERNYPHYRLVLVQRNVKITREREVLKGIVSGMINKEIAAQMGVSVATVITHRNNLTDKLGTRSVAALTIFAVMHGIVQSEELI